MLQSNAAAFSAYKILYYPIDAETLGETTKDTGASSTDALNASLTVQKNLSNTSYVLSERSLALLARYYDAIGEISADNPAMVDPAADIRRMQPEGTGKPLYPDFPTQVLQMSEDDFRLDQMLHYLSTYGVELLFAQLGTPTEVMSGWRPNTEETEKNEDPEQLVEKQIVEVVFSPAAMLATVASELSRPMRMSEPALKLFAQLIGNPKTDIELPPIAFHENMMEILRFSAHESSSTLATCCSALAQHPGDILKAALWTAEKDGVKHLKTKQKKGFCQALEKYPADSIATNLVDLGKTGSKAANMLSVARFAGESLKKATEAVESGSVKSYYAQVEAAWKTYDETGKSKELLSIYGQRPGILLRSLARLHRSGINPDEIRDEALKHTGCYSMATLTKLATLFGAQDLNVNAKGSKKGLFSQLTKFPETFQFVSKLSCELLYKEMELINTPLKGKKIFINSCGFSLSGSIVLPNEVSSTSEAYPPIGMAYDIPTDKIIRFFTFWNDPSHRIDVDIHFFGETTEHQEIHIGWNAHYKTCGMVTSGDITDSHNAAEYLDIDMEKSKELGADYVYQHAHIYSGAKNWSDIETCFSGAMLVSSQKANIKLYNGKNVLFQDDMTAPGNHMDYALINITDHWVRLLRGATLPFCKTSLDLASYILMLLEAQGSELVETEEESDLILSIGRSDEENSICLIDEGFFIK